MSENDGERELVLGNKQLLGIFFVATLLCGVFFAMGYVVGGNSAKAGAAATADGAETPSTDGKREEPTAPPVTSAATPASNDTGSSIPAAEPLMSDNPAAAGPQPTYVPSTSTPPPPSTAAAAKPTAPAANDMSISVPETGASYLQVAALEKDTAGRLVASIREKGLPAILATSSKPDLYEALVGPYRSSLTLAEAKNKLKALGFDPIVHKQ